MIEVELEPLEWIIKVNEKLTLIIRKIMDNKDLSEDEWELLRIWWTVQYNGEYPLYKKVIDEPSQTVTQIGLFSDVMSCSEEGMKIDYVIENKDNDTKKI